MNKISIEQIYNFVSEIPELSKKNNQGRILIFIKSINDENEYFKLYKESVSFLIRGVKKEINIFNAPDFLNKTDFLKWFYFKIGIK